MGKIPETDAIEELARFWDTHDLTDFEEELEEVKEPVFDLRGGSTVQFEDLERRRRRNASGRQD